MEKKVEFSASPCRHIPAQNIRPTDIQVGMYKVKINDSFHMEIKPLH